MTQSSDGPKAATATRIGVLIADKNPVIRTGLTDIIGRDSRFAIVGAVSTGADFLDQIRRGDAVIGVIGWALPDIPGGEVLAALRRAGAPARVIVYTGETGVDVLRRAIRGGAWGFISKSEEPAALIETIAAVARGRVSFPYIDLEALNQDPLAALTIRERELLGALANGWSNLQIAARFGISRNTVKYHLKNLYDRLEVNNRAMAVALYMAAGNKPEGGAEGRAAPTRRADAG